jgi:hemoglobin/transferrin/lactoferrin receptor protein
VHPGAYYRYASAEDAHIVRGEARGLYGENVGYTGGVTWRDIGDVRGGTHTGLQESTGYDSLSGDVKARWQVSDRLTITSAFQSMDLYDVSRTHSTVYGASFHGTQIGTDLQREFDQTRRMAYLRAEATPAK